MCLVQGGGSFNVFCLPVFGFLCGADPASLDPCIEDVPDKCTREFLNKVFRIYFASHVILYIVSFSV